MNKKFDYTPLIRYTDYAEKKYIKPEKAGDLKEDMELFRENGQEARKIFTQIAKSLEEKLDNFHVQKVSSWMNQAQIARPFLWVFFKRERTKKVGISLEVGFIERKIGKNTLERQNKVLDLAIEPPLYYFVQYKNSKDDCKLQRIEGNSTNREILLRDMENGLIRKVLVKYDVEEISKFKTLEDLTQEFLKGFRLLMPFYLKTKEI